MKNRFVIIDGNAIVHRAWHAFQAPLTTKDGRIVTGAYGFTTMLLKAIKDLKPTHLAVTFDLPGGTFRDEAFKEYKAHRIAQPDELYEQIPLVKEILEAFHIPIYEAEGFEADDVIGTLSKKAPKDTEVVIVTGDHDTLQLVDDRTKVFANVRGMSNIKIYDKAAIKERYGLRPDQLIDYKAMRGDASDNLPGLRGIGEKRATELLQKYDTIEGIYKAVKSSPEDFKPGVLKSLQEGEGEVPLSKKMVTIVRDLKLPFSFNEAKMEKPDMDALSDIFQDLEFKGLHARVMKQFGEEVKEAPLKTVKKKDAGFELFKKAESFVEYFKGAKAFSFRFGYATEDRIRPKFRALALFDGKKAGVLMLSDNGVAAEIAKLFADANTVKAGHDVKGDMTALRDSDAEMKGDIKDILLMSYLLNPGSRAHDLASLIFEETGKKYEVQDSLFPEEGAKVYAEEAKFIWKACKKLEAELDDEELTKVYDEIDMPLVPILSSMERHGIKLDTDFLAKMQVTLESEIARVTKRVYKEAGKEFNIHSPAQLQEILFGDLGLSSKGIKKTSTGQISTKASELEKLRGLHPIVDDIFVHREYSKLLSTYVKALPEQVHPATGRLHTSFDQAVAATGRLSSNNPNLQNIPIRTELGREVRKAFVAEKGHVLISADYSQIELRIAAHLTGDKKMIAVFKRGEDVHTSTAAEIWGIPLANVTSEQRSAAKAINFGILYGMGPNALAAQTGITTKEAREFIDTYLEVFSGVRVFMEKSRAQAKKEGWVETMFGRRRYLPEIHSGVPYLKAEAERMAINMPMQGTQADIIKIAMKNVHAYLEKTYGLGEGADVKMLLQVHDELVFEAKKSEAPSFAKWVRASMETAAKLRVPIDVDVEMGQSWGEMKPV